MALLILVRHGQSIWNAANLFTGWENVELSEKGILEAKKAGNQLSEINFDLVSNVSFPKFSCKILSDIAIPMPFAKPCPNGPVVTSIPKSISRSG